MPIIYLGAAFYLVYFIKRCEDLVADTNKTLNYGEIWLLIETMIFIYQIFMGTLFLLFAYCSKMRPFMRDEYKLENDDNPWNNKNTEDFLRHLKLEYYNMSLQMV